MINSKISVPEGQSIFLPVRDISEKQIGLSIGLLNRSDRGHRAMILLLEFLDNSGADGLDQAGIASLITLLDAALTTRNFITSDLIRAAL